MGRRVNVYTVKRGWKIFLFLFALSIGIFSLNYTNRLVLRLDAEERKKIELWAEATNQLINAGIGPSNNVLASRIVQENTTIPTILTDEVGVIIGDRNIPHRKNKEAYLLKQLEIMKEQHEPIKIEAKMNGQVILVQYLYYKDSFILSQLRYYPTLQLIIIFLFICVSYLAFSRSRKSEQNFVWAGMAKETAHQIGTPLSSLMAWVEILKSKDGLSDIAEEINKDVVRLETITERFSKIGSMPTLREENVHEILTSSVSYLRTRLSDNINITLNNQSDNTIVPVNKMLFEWVIENVCKNAADAMQGIGKISINLNDKNDYLCVEIQDTGKGLSKNHFKRIFEPGFTTKKRGWGLGLSLSKRIIENYHKGKLFVKSSEKEKGTILCILLHVN